MSLHKAYNEQDFKIPLKCPFCHFSYIHLHDTESYRARRGSEIAIYLSCESCGEFITTYTFYKGQTFVNHFHELHGKKELWRD